MDKFQSRKYRTAWFLTLLFTALLALPGIATLILTICGSTITFSLMPVEYYVTFMTGIWFAYFGANVVEKHKSFIQEEVKTKVTPVDSAGGQPADVTND